MCVCVCVCSQECGREKDMLKCMDLVAAAANTGSHFALRLPVALWQQQCQQASMQLIFSKFLLSHIRTHTGVPPRVSVRYTAYVFVTYTYMCTLTYLCRNIYPKANILSYWAALCAYKYEFYNHFSPTCFIWPKDSTTDPCVSIFSVKFRKKKQALSGFQFYVHEF